MNLIHANITLYIDERPITCDIHSEYRRDEDEDGSPVWSVDTIIVYPFDKDGKDMTFKLSEEDMERLSMTAYTYAAENAPTHQG